MRQARPSMAVLPVATEQRSARELSSAGAVTNLELHHQPGSSLTLAVPTMFMPPAPSTSGFRLAQPGEEPAAAGSSATLLRRCSSSRDAA